MRKRLMQLQFRHVAPWAAAVGAVGVTYVAMRQTTVMDPSDGWRPATFGDNAPTFVYAGIAGVLALQIGLAVATIAARRRDVSSTHCPIRSGLLIATSTVCWLIGGAICATIASIWFTSSPRVAPPHGPGLPTMLIAVVIGGLAMVTGGAGLYFLRRWSRSAARRARWSVVVTLIATGLWPIITLESFRESARATHAPGAAFGAFLICFILPCLFAIWIVGQLVLVMSLARSTNESPTDHEAARDGAAP